MDAPLLKAARTGNLELVKAMEEVKGTEIFHQTTHNQNTALHMAARFGHLDLVGYIIRRDYSRVLCGNINGETPVHIAARAGHDAVVEVLMKHVNQFSKVYVARVKDKRGNTPLHGAVRHNRLPVVKMLTAEDRDSLLLVNDAGESPLSIAIDRTLPAMSKYILKRNPATVNYRGPNGQTPLHFAVLGQDLDVMVSMLENITAPASSKKAHEGMAVLVRNSAFKAFVISDATAMTTSICAAVLIMWSSAHRDCESLMDNLPYAMLLTWVALVAMTVAFVTGLVAVISDIMWLAIAVCVIACLLPAIFYFVAPLAHLQNRRYSAIENNPFVFVKRLMSLELAAAFRSLRRLRQWCRKDKSASEIVWV